MKKFITLSLLALTLIPSISLADIKCSAIVFDLAKSQSPEISPMTFSESEYWAGFEGQLRNVGFVVNINKDSQEVTAYMYYLKKDGNEDFARGRVSTIGAFSSKGNFEFSTSRGGNIMMPQNYEAISCKKE